MTLVTRVTMVASETGMVSSYSPAWLYVWISPQVHRVVDAFLTAQTPTEPSLIFSGYVHGGQNLVGRWRETITPVDRPGWEGAWSMKKVA
jgi:hypothetical protein